MALATVTALTAKPGVQQIKLTATVSDPNADGLPYLAYKDVEFTVASVNDRADASAAVIGTERLTLTHAGVPEEVTRYYWARPRFSYVNASGATVIYYGDYYPSSATGGVSGRAIGMSGLAFGIANGKIVVDDNASDAAVASGALRVAIKNLSGTNPTADEPIFLAQPVSSAGQGSYTPELIDYAMANTIGAGSTLGVTADTPFAVWIVAVLSGGTEYIGLINPIGPQIGSGVGGAKEYSLDEAIKVEQADAAVGATGDAAGVVYVPFAPTPARLSIRILGVMIWETGLATPGTWVRPTETQLYSRGMKHPGDVVKILTDSYAVAATVATTIPYDDTWPQVTEGSLVTSTSALRMASLANWMLVECEAEVSVDVTDHVIATLFKSGATGNVSGAAIEYCVAGQQTKIKVSAVIRPGSIDPTIKLHLGAATGGTTITVNGVAGARKLGGATAVRWKLTEITG